MKISIENFKFSFKQAIVLFLLFLAGMNVLNMYYYFCLAAALAFFLLQKNFVLDANVLFLLALSLSWALFSPETASLTVTSLIKPFLYPLIYIVGRSFFARGMQTNGISVEEVFVPTLVILASVSWLWSTITITLWPSIP